MNATSICYIYALVDPREPEEIRYIGKTEAPHKRLIGHLREARMRLGYKNWWIKNLQRDGVLPILRPLRIVPVADWQRHERELIAIHKGPRLTNGNEGGLGGGMPADWVRAKMSESGKRATPRMHAVRSAEMNKRWATKEFQDKQRRAHLGFKQKPEDILKRIQFRIGMKDTPEVVAKRRAAVVASHGVAVKNIETGETFDSFSAAARAVGGQSPNIRRSTLVGYAAHGFHWEIA